MDTVGEQGRGSRGGSVLEAGEEGEVADDILGVAAVVSQGSDAEAVVAFSEALTFCVVEEGDMGVGWGGSAEHTVEQELSWCGEEDIFAADDLGNAHTDIVDDHGELVGPHAVGAAQGEVAAAAFQGNMLGAEDEVVEGFHVVVGAGEAQGMVSAFCLFLCALFPGKVSAGTGVGGSGVAEAVCGAVGGAGEHTQFLARAVAGVDMGFEFIEGPFVQGAAQALVVGAVRAVVGAFIPVQAQPGEVAFYGIHP